MTVPAQRPSAPSASGKNASTFPLVIGFWVVVDGVPLPSFTECQGIGATYAVDEWTEGGQNGYVHKLPGRLTYGPITLTRHVDGSSGALAAWFNSAPQQDYRTARVTAVDLEGTSIAHWDLVGVFPSSYTGPSFSAGSTSAATESLELQHHGFTFAYSTPGGS